MKRHTIVKPQNMKEPQNVKEHLLVYGHLRTMYSLTADPIFELGPPLELGASIFRVIPSTTRGNYPSLETDGACKFASRKLGNVRFTVGADTFPPAGFPAALRVLINLDCMLEPSVRQRFPNEDKNYDTIFEVLSKIQFWEKTLYATRIYLNRVPPEEVVVDCPLNKMITTQKRGDQTVYFEEKVLRKLCVSPGFIWMQDGYRALSLEEVSRDTYDFVTRALSEEELSKFT